MSKHDQKKAKQVPKGPKTAKKSQKGPRWPKKITNGSKRAKNGQKRPNSPFTLLATEPTTQGQKVSKWPKSN